MSMSLFSPPMVPEEYPDLAKPIPKKARVGVAQHIASLGIPVLAISLPGHYSRKPWAPIAERRPEFIIGQIPSDTELSNRLAVYTFRMCTEAVKALVEKNLHGSDLHVGPLHRRRIFLFDGTVRS